MMPLPLRLSLICHARTTLRPSRFPADEPLAEGIGPEIERLARLIPRPTSLHAGPGLCTFETAEILSTGAVLEPALADIDRGCWAGRNVQDIEEEEPGALSAWMADPQSAPHGGESRAALLARVAGWLQGGIRETGHVIAVSYPEVLRAAMAATLDAPASSLAAIDVEHLALLDLRSDGRRWAVRSFGRL